MLVQLFGNTLVLALSCFKMKCPCGPSVAQKEIVFCGKTSQRNRLLQHSEVIVWYFERFFFSRYMQIMVAWWWWWCWPLAVTSSSVLRAAWVASFNCQLETNCAKTFKQFKSVACNEVFIIVWHRQHWYLFSCSYTGLSMWNRMKSKERALCWVKHTNWY